MTKRYMDKETSVPSGQSEPRGNGLGTGKWGTNRQGGG